MKFLWFYLISTGIVIFMQCIYQKGIEHELKRKYPKQYKPQYPSICEWLSIEMPMFIPILNILFLLGMIFGREKVVNRMENMIESGMKNAK
ncbi:MAG TPA: hypothetical protein VHP31_11885 [Caproicibacter sp.]|nr:hypothetical protein [Caproicibacter sp.]